MLHREDGLVAAEIGSICVAMWRENSTLPRVERQRAALNEVVGKYPGEAGFLCVVESSSAAPDDEARKASSRMIEEHGSRLRAVAVVIEGSGFRASIVRSVASGIVLLARSKSKTPVSYFANVAEGVNWLSNVVTLGNQDDFVRSVEELRGYLKKN
jgi:hypothetical protein